jgi:hypothetical protein
MLNTNTKKKELIKINYRYKNNLKGLNIAYCNESIKFLQILLFFPFKFDFIFEIKFVYFELVYMYIVTVTIRRKMSFTLANATVSDMFNLLAQL